VLAGCGSDIPEKSDVKSYLRKTYGVREFTIVSEGYDGAYLDASKLGDYGYVIVDVQGEEFKIKKGQFGGLSDNYIDTIRDRQDILEYLQDVYVDLPAGVKVDGNWGPYSGRLNKFPITYEEVVKNSSVSIVYTCDSYDTMINEFQTLIDMRKELGLTDRTKLSIEGEGGDFKPIYVVLKTGEIACTSTDVDEVDRHSGIAYPYADDAVLNDLYRQDREPDSGGSEIRIKISDRISEIGKELDKTGYL
jgi:hypothetical protein